VIPALGRRRNSDAAFPPAGPGPNARGSSVSGVTAHGFRDQALLQRRWTATAWNPRPHGCIVPVRTEGGTWTTGYTRSGRRWRLAMQAASSACAPPRPGGGRAVTPMDGARGPAKPRAKPRRQEAETPRSDGRCHAWRARARCMGEPEPIEVIRIAVQAGHRSAPSSRAGPAAQARISGGPVFSETGGGLAPAR